MSEMYLTTIKMMLFTLCAYSKGPIRFIKRSRSWFKYSLLQLQPLLCNMLFKHAWTHSRAVSCISRAYVVTAARSPVRCDTWSSGRWVAQKHVWGKKVFLELLIQTNWIKWDLRYSSWANLENWSKSFLFFTCHSWLWNWGPCTG